MLPMSVGERVKTSLEIAEDVLERAEQLAAERRVTLSAIVEEGLRHVLEAERRPSPFRLRDATFTGEGLQPAFDGAAWARIRDAAPEGHGE
jgi:hypothetical protein